MRIIKQILTFTIIIALVLNSTSVFAGFIWESSGLDFYKTIDRWYTTYQTRLLENSLAGSAEKVNEFLSGSNVVKLDNLIDFTKTELDIVTDWWLSPILKRINFEWNSEANTNRIMALSTKIKERYILKKDEILKNISNASKISVIWLYNDWDIGNSWYDIVNDIERIHSVIFTDSPKYNWIKNSAASDFNGILNWLNNTSFLPNLGWLFNNSWSNNAAIPQATNSWATINKATNNSNLCNTGISLIGLDGSLLSDIDRQVNLWDNSNSNNWWIGNITRNPFNSWNLNAGNSNPWFWNNNSRNWPCIWFICIKIEFTSYSHGLLGWWSSTIEWIIDKNLKIIDKTAGKSWIQADMSKLFFWLSILRQLNLPAMLHLWLEVSSLPVPILNLDNSKKIASQWDSAKKVWSCNDLKNTEIFSSAFHQIWLDYIRPNYINPDLEYKDVSNSVWIGTNGAINKVTNTENVKLPAVNETDILIAGVKASCWWWLNDNVSELVWFSNTFKNNITTILDYVDYMIKTK